MLSELAQLIRDKKAVIMAPFSANVTNKAKQQFWETIRNQMNGVNSVSKLRDVILANIRRCTLKKISE